jgi:hypothetical protein
MFGERMSRSQSENAARVYVCPMHRDVRQATAGKCPKCGMDLLPEGTRFGLLRHMISSPVHLTIMVAVMAVVMIAVMLIMR